MGKVVKKVAPIAGAVLPFALPGIGTLGSVALGAGLGALGGGGVKGAVLGGLGGGIGSAAGIGAIGKGFGVSPSVASGLGKAVSGGLGAAAQGGDFKDVALGAGLGGIGGYVTSGGSVPGLGDVGETINWNQGGTSVLRPGSGALGSLSSLTNATSAGGQPMKLGSLLSAGGDALGYMQSQDDLDDIQSMLARQSQLAQAQYQPYAAAGQTALANMQAPSMEALQADPGYQFRLQQGQQALERSLGARGMNQSGAALKAAQEYGQGLADQTYNDYFTRQSRIANNGLTAASGLGSLYTNLGNVQAAAELARINQRNNLYSGLGGLFR